MVCMQSSNSWFWCWLLCYFRVPKFIYRSSTFFVLVYLGLENWCCFLTALQYYLKTGTCKFGATCKFHHPRDKAGIAGRVSLNILGYPLRPVWILIYLSLTQLGRMCYYYLTYLFSPFIFTVVDFLVRMVCMVEGSSQGFAGCHRYNFNVVSANLWKSLNVV